jgi:hypothetical protein
MRPLTWTNDRPFFFKYVDRRIAKIILTYGTLRWSTPATLNDPYDMQLNLLLGIDRKKLKAETLRRLWDAHYVEGAALPQNQLGKLIAAGKGSFPKMSRNTFNRQFGPAFDESVASIERSLPQTCAEVRSGLSQGKILCLTELPDNLMMWTHYAENQQGAVLRFRSVPELTAHGVPLTP